MTYLKVGVLYKIPIFEFLVNFISIFKTINKNTISGTCRAIDPKLFTMVYNLFTIDNIKKLKKNM